MHLRATRSKPYRTTHFCTFAVAMTLLAWTSVRAQDDVEQKGSTVAELRARYRELQSETIEKAKQINAPQAKPRSANEIDAVRGELRDALRATFAVGQELLAAEVKQRQKQIEPLERQIAERERMKQQIIDQRMAELLTPRSLSWEPRFQSASNPSSPQPSYPSYVSPARVEGKRMPVSRPATHANDAVVWLEIVVSKRGEKGESFSAAYVNGTVVSSDGLVAVALGRGATKKETEKAFGSATLFLKDGRSLPAKLVQFDGEFGVALLKCSAGSLPYLQPSKGPVAQGRRLTFHGVRFDPHQINNREDGTTYWKMFVSVVSADYTLDEKSGFFTVETMFTDDSVGAAFVSLDGRLNGILGGSIHQPYIEPTASAPPPKRSSSWAIPAHAIAKLVDAFRTAGGEQSARTASDQPQLAAEVAPSHK